MTSNFRCVHTRIYQQNCIKRGTGEGGRKIGRKKGWGREATNNAADKDAHMPTHESPKKIDNRLDDLQLICTISTAYADHGKVILYAGLTDSQLVGGIVTSKLQRTQGGRGGAGWSRNRE